MHPPRSHPLSRSRFAGFANNALEALWSKGVTAKPPLEPDFLWQMGAKGFDKADEVSIRSADEVADFRERLKVLCSSLRNEARLNALGHTMAYGQLTSAIRWRHALGRLWRKSPDLARTQLASPIAVVGQMRAGTTRVHRLLAADPRHVGTRFCDSHDPVPKKIDWRPAKAAAVLALARRINPWLDSLHPFGARRIDEEIGWLAGALSPCAFEAQWHIPSYVLFNEARDQRPVYREFARILRTDAAVRKNADRRRIMKCPQFSEDVAALIEALPATRVVVAHRDSEEVLASSVSLAASQMAFQSEESDIESIQLHWMRKLSLREQRIEQALRDLQAPAAHVEFEALNADWEAQIRQVYRSLGIEPIDAAMTAMAKEFARAKNDAHSSHRIQLAKFAESRT